VRLPPIPTLGIDPGMNTGLAIVGPEGIVWSMTARWKDLDDTALAELLQDDRHLYHRAFSEHLGHTRSDARARASSWATSYRYAGRVDEMVRRVLGTYPIRVTPELWRPAVGLSGNPGTPAILTLARTIPGFSVDASEHAANAALIACYQE
jgi:hypothetical protein